jgi:hypothetical protein
LVYLTLTYLTLVYPTLIERDKDMPSRQDAGGQIDLLGVLFKETSLYLRAILNHIMR